MTIEYHHREDKLDGPYYEECGRPAKFEYEDRLRGKIKVCGIHAKGKRAVPIIVKN